MGSATSREKQGETATPANSSECPVLNPATAPEALASGANTSNGSCPVPELYRSTAVYNVYAQRIDGAAQEQQRGYLDPSNNMPREPNQRPWAGQQAPLSTERSQSTIPKGGTQGSWLYPSPQMFYNALMRKGKGDGVAEADMESVVHAHNSMNEKTWQRVLEWERLHEGECADPRLSRFIGRPDDLSPLARLKSWGGKQLPFDRHDWWVDRCGGEVRYVIDFYYNEDKGGTPEAFELTVRPALDSPSAALDRLKMSIYLTCAKYGLPCPVTGHGGKFSDAAASSSSLRDTASLGASGSRPSENTSP